MFSYFGLIMVGCILFCFVIGYFLDKWFGMKGLFIIIFIIFGVIGGGVIVYRQIDQVFNLSNKKKDFDSDNSENG